MPTRRRRAIGTLAWATFVVVAVGLGFQVSHGQQAQKRPFGGAPQGMGQGLGGRDCLGCHKAFATKYLGMKDVHAVVRENKCDSCHVRHGLVPTLAMKREGNELCLTCHPKDKLGLNKAHVHTAVKSGACTLCHDPHASKFDHLLKADPGRAVLPVPRQGELPEEGRAQGPADERLPRLPYHARRRRAQSAGEGGEGPVPRLPPGDGAGVQQGARRLPGGPGVVQPVPQSPQLGCSPRCSRPACTLPCRPRSATAATRPPRRPSRSTSSRRGASCAWPATMPPPSRAPGRCSTCRSRTASASCATTRTPRRTSGCSRAGGRPSVSSATRRWRSRSPSSTPPSPPSGAACRATASHSSDNEKLLTAPADTLCASCHANVSEAAQKSKTQHPPAAGGECTACHNPHGSNVKGMLKDRTDRVCYGCHTDAEARFTKTYTHAPVQTASANPATSRTAPTRRAC